MSKYYIEIDSFILILSFFFIYFNQKTFKKIKKIPFFMSQITHLISKSIMGICFYFHVKEK